MSRTELTFSPPPKVQKKKSSTTESDGLESDIVLSPRATPQPRKVSAIPPGVGWVSPVNVPIALPTSFHLPVKVEETPTEDREAADALIAMTSQPSTSSFELPLHQKRKMNLSICTTIDAKAQMSRLISPAHASFAEERSDELSDPHSLFASPHPYPSASIDDLDSNSSDSYSYVTPLRKSPKLEISPRACYRTPEFFGGNSFTLDMLADTAAGQLTSSIISSEFNSMGDMGNIAIQALANLRADTPMNVIREREGTSE